MRARLELAWLRLGGPGSTPNSRLSLSAAKVRLLKVIRVGLARARGCRHFAARSLGKFMKATLMYGSGDVRVETVPDPVIQQPTDAIVRTVRACVCGSDLHPYHSLPPTAGGTPMGHELIGVVEETGGGVTSVKKGDFVIATFAFQDNTCVFCREGFQTSCRRDGDVNGLNSCG